MRSYKFSPFLSLSCACTRAARWITLSRPTEIFLLLLFSFFFDFRLPQFAWVIDLRQPQVDTNRFLFFSTCGSRKSAKKATVNRIAAAASGKKSKNYLSQSLVVTLWRAAERG